MHGDSSSANRTDPDPMCSTSFGEYCTGHPALPALVDNGAAAPKSCLSPLQMRLSTTARGLLPAGETSTATKTTFDHPTLWFCLTEETNLRTSTQSVSYDSSFSGRITSLLPPLAGGSLRQSHSKIVCSIQAVLKVVSAPARFWERGARCFVVRLCVSEQLLTICGVFLAGRMTWASTFSREVRESLTPYVLWSMEFFPAARLALMPCQAMGAGGANEGHAVEGGSRLWDVRGERLSGSAMGRRAWRQGTPWSACGECDQ